MKIIILDFDGTIADTSNSIIQTIHKVVDELGFPKVEDFEIKNLIGLTLRDIFIKLLNISDEDELQNAIKIYRKLQPDHLLSGDFKSCFLADSHTSESYLKNY